MLDHRPEEGQGPVAVVEQVDQARLLGPVDVGGGDDLPEATPTPARVGGDLVVVLVASDVGDHAAVAQEETAQRLVAARRRAGPAGPAREHAVVRTEPVVDAGRLVAVLVAAREAAREELVHRPKRVVREGQHQLAAPVGPPELAVHPAELGVAHVAARSPAVGHGVQHEEDQARAGPDDVVALAASEVRPGEAVPVGGAARPEVLAHVAPLLERQAARVAGHDLRPVRVRRRVLCGLQDVRDQDAPGLSLLLLGEPARGQRRRLGERLG